MLLMMVKVALGGLEQKQPKLVRVRTTVSLPSAVASKIVFKPRVAVDWPAGIVTLAGRGAKSEPALAVPDTWNPMVNGADKSPLGSLENVKTPSSQPSYTVELPVLVT